MGNCQATDTATLVIQHPNGKVERMYYSVSASQIMKTNPGHYVALLISSTLCPSQHNHHHQHNTNNSVRLTRIKLLQRSDSLLLGHVYRLITSQEVMRGLWAKKQAKMNKTLSETERRSFELKTITRINDMENNQVDLYQNCYISPSKSQEISYLGSEKDLILVPNKTRDILNLVNLCSESMTCMHV